MSEDYQTPGDFYGRGENKTPGFNAVRDKYGEDMVTRFKNWPKLEAVYLEAQGLDETDRAYTDAIDTSRRKVERAARDREYALAQAEMIVRAGIPRHEWAAVPVAEHLRREWWPDPDPAREAVRAWARENPNWPARTESESGGSAT